MARPKPRTHCPWDTTRPRTDGAADSCPAAGRLTQPHQVRHYNLQIGGGRTIEALLADYPYLEREDVLEALRYAAWRAEEREVDLQRAS